eukprot:GSMAST32.ASY1.ANO1.945.1 assembled CDS
MARLTQDQRKAVTASFDRPLAIIASAGAGKTLTLTCRIINMLQSGIKAENICVVTFTRKAANEIRERVSQVFRSESIRTLQVCTFHGFCLRILKRNVGATGRSIQALDSTNLRILNKVDQIEKDFVDTEISNGTEFGTECKTEKNNSQKDPVVEKSQKSGAAVSEFFEIYKMYEKNLQEKNLVDFADIIPMCLMLLKTNANTILKNIRKKFTHFLVDEFQDICFIVFQIRFFQQQIDLIQLLCEKSLAITVVGDDDQQIYSFRGSSARAFVLFQDIFPTTQILTLKRNFRSTKTIVKAAFSLIQHNDYKCSKDLKHSKHSKDSKDSTGVLQQLVSTNPSKNGPILMKNKNIENNKSIENIGYSSRIPIYAFFGREQKNIWTSNANGSKLHLLPCLNIHHEVSRIASNIRHHWSERGRRFRDICVLARTKRLAKMVEVAIKKLNIPTLNTAEHVSGDAYATPEVKDLRFHFNFEIRFFFVRNFVPNKFRFFFLIFFHNPYSRLV